jgi:hypothetical protein
MPFPIRPDMLWATARVALVQPVVPGPVTITVLRSAGINPNGIQLVQGWPQSPVFPPVPAIISIPLATDAQLDPADAMVQAWDATPSIPGPNGGPLAFAGEQVADDTIEVFVWDPFAFQTAGPMTFNFDLLVQRLF